MNADNFTQYLEDPSLLYQASYQELKSLALQYPYCQNLHLLLFQKSYMEDSDEWEQNLEKAAIYSIDRKHLYHQTRELDKKAASVDTFLLSEEFLELKSLESLQLEEPALPDLAPEESDLQLEFSPVLQEPSAGQKTGPTTLPPVSINEEEEEDADDFFEINAGLAPKEEHGRFRENLFREEPEAGLAEPVSDEQPTPHAEAASETALPSFLVEEELINACSSLIHIATLATPPPVVEDKALTGLKKSHRPMLSPELEVLKQKTRHRPVFIVERMQDDVGLPPKPQPKQSFTSWVEQFQSANVQVRLSELMESKKREESRKKRKKKKNAKAHSPGVGRLAIKSITENKEILSETLAELLASQGEYLRAIEMYRALMLVFPKKSDYFAVKIENLKSN